MNVISSIPSLFNFRREGFTLDGLMKRYAIIFDQIIFNRHGAPIGPGDFYETLPEFIAMFTNPEGDRLEQKAISHNKRFQNIFIDCWDVVDDAAKFESMRQSIIPKDMQDRLGAFYFPEVRRANGLPENSFDFDFHDVKELAGDIRADIGLNLLAVYQGIEVIPSFSPIIGRALSNEILNNGGDCHDLFSDGLLVPNFDEFSWDEILEFREDSSVRNFRKVAHGIIDSNLPLNAALQTRVQEDLWSIARDYRPNITNTILSAVASNLPSLLVNPVGIGLAAKDIRDVRRMEEKYGHVFFIQKMRSLKHPQ